MFTNSLTLSVFRKKKVKGTWRKSNYSDIWEWRKLQWRIFSYGNRFHNFRGWFNRVSNLSWQKIGNYRNWLSLIKGNRKLIRKNIEKGQMNCPLFFYSFVWIFWQLTLLHFSELSDNSRNSECSEYSARRERPEFSEFSDNSKFSEYSEFSEFSELFFPKDQFWIFRQFRIFRLVDQVWKFRQLIFQMLDLAIVRIFKQLQFPFNGSCNCQNNFNITTF